MSQARRHCHILLFLALLLHKGALLLTNCGALKKSLNLSFLTSSSGKKNIRITADLLGPFSCKCLRVIPAWVGPVRVLNTPTMSLTPSLCVKWGLRSINHLTEGRHKNHWAPYAQKPCGVHRIPEGHSGVTLGSCCLPLMPSLLLSHNWTISLRLETLSPSSVPLRHEHSASANLVPFMKLLLAATS